MFFEKVCIRRIAVFLLCMFFIVSWSAAEDPPVANTSPEEKSSSGSGENIDTSKILQVPVGAINVDSAEWGISAAGKIGAGYFFQATSDATLADGSGVGILASGNNIGATFTDKNQSGEANLAWGDMGIVALGYTVGGHFTDANSSGLARCGYGDTGVNASGDWAGGYFEEGDSDAYARLGSESSGIRAEGPQVGGYFVDSNQSGKADVGYQDRGIYARGNEAGGHFVDSDGSGNAYCGYGDTGVNASGSWAGGYFLETDSDAHALLGSSHSGIRAQGPTVGGYFVDSDQSGKADVAYEDRGIYARGNEAGGHFVDLDSSGEAWVGYGDYGIHAEGDTAGGYFVDSSSGGTYASIASGMYKIFGTGMMSFVQNHPQDKTQVIVYAAPEGDEAATYTRGSARLENGIAKVPLGETFKWVTNPDIGLTVHLTPRGDWADLYVVSVNTEELEVASRTGTADVAFDYLVYGLRIGFEEASIVQAKRRDAPIPSMKNHHNLYREQPELRSFNSLERFTRMQTAPKEDWSLDLSAAHALRDAIGAFDPNIVAPASLDEDRSETSSEARVHDLHDGSDTYERQFERPDDHLVEDSFMPPSADTDTDFRARSLRPSLPGLATLLPAFGDVAVGDVVAADPDNPALIRQADKMAEPTVVGIAVDEAGVTLTPNAQLAGDTESGSFETGVAAIKQIPVAQSGIVMCRVDAGYGAIRPGDLLIASATPGHAALALDPKPGTVVAKALEPLEYGTGLIRVLVLLR